MWAIPLTDALKKGWVRIAMLLQRQMQVLSRCIPATIVAHPGSFFMNNPVLVLVWVLKYEMNIAATLSRAHIWNFTAKLISAFVIHNQICIIRGIYNQNTDFAMPIPKHYSRNANT